MKRILLSNLLGAVIYFVIMHFVFRTNTLAFDIFSTVVFYIVMTITTWYRQKPSKKD